MKRKIGLFICFLGALEAASPVWLNCKVITVGHVAGEDGSQILTAKVLLEDPGNINPGDQRKFWLVTQETVWGKTNLKLTEGMKFKAYIFHRSLIGYGLLVVEYLDSKGRVKSEYHGVIQPE